MGTQAGAEPGWSAGLAAVVNRWLSPDHPLGQALMRIRIKAQLLTWRPEDPAEQRLKQAVRVLAPDFTMVDLPRLRSLAALALGVARGGVPGALVECGTWRGGSLALADWVLRSEGKARPTWGFDSFAGLPAPDHRDGAAVRRSYFSGWCTATEADVREAFARVGSTGSSLRLVAGWLSETLPRTETGPIALLNVDVDWYDSVTSALEGLYDQVVPGGFVRIDDYGRWPGCDRAVHDFLVRRGLSLRVLVRTGTTGAWFSKPQNV